MQITNGNPMQRLSNDVLLLATCFAGLIFKPDASLLSELRSKIEWSRGHGLIQIGGAKKDSHAVLRRNCQSTSGRKSSHRTFPPLSRSMAMANFSAHVRYP